MNLEKLWLILKEMNVLKLLIVLSCNMYSGQEGTVMPEYGETEQSPNGKVIRQRFILSPSLFNLYGLD